MESLKGGGPEMGNFESGPGNEHQNANWAQVVDNVVNKFTGKNMEVTYDFDNLQINLPEVTGPDGILVGGVKLEIKGKFLISTKLQNGEE